MINSGKFKQTTVVAATLFFSVVTLLGAPMRTYAATTNPAPAAKVSFTFDDGYASAYSQAAPTLAKYGFSGTDYVITGLVGKRGMRSNQNVIDNRTYMTWSEVKQLQSTYKWEIGSHTVTHPYLASTDPVEQPNPLTPAQITQEIVNSKTALAAQGINATAFAPPYGDYNMPVLAEIAKNYGSMRGFADTGYNTWPNNEYLLRVQQVQAGVSVATVKGYIDAAIQNKQWLILVFHEIKTNPSVDPDDYEYKTSDLDQIAAYVKLKNMPVVNPSSAMATSDTNLLPNSSFNNGVADGWTTDTPAAVTKDTANNGSYPDATNAIKFVAGSTESHLFSPKTTVDPNTTYLLKNFLNVQKLTSGELGFYIDEYDSFGNWISGQYKTAERSVFVENLNFTYKPSSANVSKASLQVFATANSGITAYLDNTQWFPLSSVAPPAQQNLVTNGTFDAGLSQGWTTDDPTRIVLDTANNGSPANPVNSIKMTAQTANKHLFSPKVAVDGTKTYSLSSYLNLKQITSGEVGYYIDEYDVNGNWISGQYKRGVSQIGAGNVGFAYQPTSASVRQASLQVVSMGNSNTVAYIDDVKWTTP
jgi:peptidoglycan/xylan/chitin deacetylase (PgdA/CDA1 family)